MSIDADEIIFHQYALSPFSEKIRKVFAHKGISYRNVEQPMWLPRPHLTPMTAAFRRIPVMQIGADIYCDTAMIADKLEALRPDPTIYPDGAAGLADIVAAWADRQLFFPLCAPLVFGAISDALPAELLADRRKMMPGLDIEMLRAAAPVLGASLAANLDFAETALDGRSHLVGDAFSIADAALFHTLWFVRNDPVSAGRIAERPRLTAWMQRVEEMGVGEPVDTDPAEAIAAAAAAEPAQASDAAGSASGYTQIAYGTKVGVFADDLPSDVVEGEVVSADSRAIVIRRESAEAGALHLHFPRAGYSVREL
jgi:glutathione S-transferase